MNADSDLPSWTSQAVAALGPAQAELLGRLTSEPRMKGCGGSSDGGGGPTALHSIRLKPSNSF